MLGFMVYMFIDVWLDFGQIRISNGERKKIWRERSGANPARTWPDCPGKFGIRPVALWPESGRILTWPTIFMFGSDFHFSFCGLLIRLSALFFSGTF